MIKPPLALVTAALAVVLVAGVTATADEPRPERPSAPADGTDKPVGDAVKKADVTKKDDAEEATDAAATEKAPVPKAGLEPGNLAPEFTLKDLDGKERALSSFRGKVVVLEWLNHGCPYVKKHYDVGNMQKLQKKAAEDGVVWLSICSSAPGKQGHMDVETWKKVQEEKGAAPTAVLPDPTGKVGQVYEAQRTPTMWVLDAEGIVVYKGALDDNAKARGDAIAEARNYVTEALAAIQAGKTPEVTTSAPYG